MKFDGLEPTAPPIKTAPESLGQKPMLAFIIVACESEPWRVGEGAFCPQGKTLKLGRGGPAIEEFLSFREHRPGDPLPQHLGFAGCLHGESVSRHQANIEAKGPVVHVENVGKHRMFLNGEQMLRMIVAPNDVVMVEGGVALLCVLRLPTFPALRYARIGHRFGEPDLARIVGEGPRAWAARDEATRLGRGSDFILILGESGTGKTGIARLIHLASVRASAPFVRHNGATFTDSIIESQMFGKGPNFPTPGPATEGLLATAHRGTLFLDEIANLSLIAQRNLLTTLDDGAYKRVGEDVLREVDLRVIGATNRERSVLQGDFHYRFGAEVRLTPLRERREDIPLLARELLRRRLKKDADLKRFFIKGLNEELVPRISVRLMDFLVRHELLGNTRELDSLLAAAAGRSAGERIEMFPDGASLQSVRPSGPVSSGPVSSAPVSGPPSTERTERRARREEVELTEERVREALRVARGNVSEAARELGVDRRKLYRKMEDLGIKPKEE